MLRNPAPTCDPARATAPCHVTPRATLPHVTPSETSIGSSPLPLKHLGDWAHTTLSRPKGGENKDGKNIHLTERLYKRTAASECNDVQTAHARHITCSYDDRKYTLMMEVVLPADGSNSIQLR